MRAAFADSLDSSIIPLHSIKQNILLIGENLRGWEIKLYKSVIDLCNNSTKYFWMSCFHQQHSSQLMGWEVASLWLWISRTSSDTWPGADGSGPKRRSPLNQTQWAIHQMQINYLSSFPFFGIKLYIPPTQHKTQTQWTNNILQKNSFSTVYIIKP